MRHFFTPGRKGGRQLFTDPMTFAKDSMGFRGIVSKVMCGVVNVVIWVGPNPLLHNAFPTSCLRVQRSKAPSGVHITQVTAPAQGSFRCCSKVSGFHKTTLAFGSCWGWITWMFWGNPAAALCYDESRGISQIWTDDQPNYKNADLCHRMVLCLHTNWHERKRNVNFLNIKIAGFANLISCACMRTRETSHEGLKIQWDGPQHFVPIFTNTVRLCRQYTIVYTSYVCAITLKFAQTWMGNFMKILHDHARFIQIPPSQFRFDSKCLDPLCSSDRNFRLQWWPLAVTARK